MPLGMLQYYSQLSLVLSIEGVQGHWLSFVNSVTEYEINKY